MKSFGAQVSPTPSRAPKRVPLRATGSASAPASGAPAGVHSFAEMRAAGVTSEAKLRNASHELSMLAR